MTDAPPRPTVIRRASWVVAWDGGHVYRRDCDVAFAGPTITAIGAAPPGPAEEIDGRGLLVLPGFVNLHAHPCSETLRKGMTDEVGSPKLHQSTLYEYLPLFESDPEGVQAAHEVALGELMLSGVTTLCDLSLPHDGWLETLAASGLRAYAAPMFRSGRWVAPSDHEVRYEWDEPAGRRGLDAALRLIDRAGRHPSGRLSGMVAPAQLDTCTDGLIADAAAAARERRLPFQIHAAQSVVEFQEIMRRHGQTPIEWLDRAGGLGPGAIVGHGVFLDHHSWLHWPSRHDLARLAGSGASVAHCPTVFARRGMTLEHFGRYRAAGINLGLGTDTFPHNMIEELRMAAIAARLAAADVHAVRTAEIFEAATVGGARALGREDLGRLAPGGRADLVLVDATHPAMRPVYDPLRSLIYAAGERPVRDVFVDGRPVVRAGRVLAFDLADAAARLEAAQHRLVARIPGLDRAGRSAAALMPLTFPLA